MSTPDGGAAFPCKDGSLLPPSTGMSLRDYFATAALQGILLRWKEQGYDREGAVHEAYQYADAMLKQREAQL